MFSLFSEATAMPAFLPQLSSMEKVAKLSFHLKLNNDNNSSNNIINKIYPYILNNKYFLEYE
jgi:hypothetical protein